MDFLYSDLGQQPRGSIVSVSITGQAANVWLMDSGTFSSYKAGRGGRAQGGRTTRSPVNFEVTRSAHWYVVLDNAGRPWNGRWGVEVLPPQPAAIRTTHAGPLESIAAAIEEVQGAESQPSYDVFVSHASEDKDDLVRPLAAALRGRGLSVWYDEFELKVGASLRRSIDRGIANSRFGIVVVSKAFFAKNWTNYELDGLVAREMNDGKQLVLPVWHNISKSEVVAASPSLADKVALRTADSTVDEIAEQVAEAIGS